MGVIIKGRKSAYLKSLNNSEWQAVRRATRIRDRHVCVECGSEINLECHHISYYANGKSILGSEINFLYCMVTLCHTCHKKVHGDPLHRFNPQNKRKTYVR